MKTRPQNLFLLTLRIAVLVSIMAGHVTAQTFTTLHSFSAELQNARAIYTNSDGASPYGGSLAIGNFPKPLPMPTNNFHRMRVSGMTCRHESTWPIYPTRRLWPVGRPPPPGTNPRLGRPAGRLERRAGRDDL